MINRHSYSQAVNMKGIYAVHIAFFCLSASVVLLWVYAYMLASRIRKLSKVVGKSVNAITGLTAHVIALTEHVIGRPIQSK